MARSTSRSRTAHSTTAPPAQSVRTKYSTIRLEPDRDNPRRYTVFLDEAPSSFIDLDDPLNVGFEYMSIMLCFIDELPSPGLNVVHLGSAGSAMARALDKLKPQSRQIGIDIDGELHDYARQWFSLPKSPRLRLRTGDAREELSKVPDGSQDVIIRDVFADALTPSHLTTTEFTQLVVKKLRPGGLYLANCADRPPLAWARQEVATLLDTCDSLNSAPTVHHKAQVAYCAENAILKGKRFGNLVLAFTTATHTPHDDTVDFANAHLHRALRTLAVPATAITGAEVTHFARNATIVRDT
ncbi:fused MFS/spermidine synthase [Timonella sp. A28]|uniref:spermidine synthase n=1 Tax=Timonella sp. A28 TaxID=3442640 RepID=UPI003EBF2A49